MNRREPQRRAIGACRRRRGTWTAAALVMVLVGVTPLAEGQDRDGRTGPTLVTRFAAEGAGPEQLAEVVTDSLELTLRLAGVPQVERADYLLPSAAPEASLRYYDRRRAAGAVYGAIERDDSAGYTIAAGIWSPDDGDVARFEQEIESVFAVFDIADELALEIASQVVGRELSFGSVEVANTEHLDAFAVYVDGQLIARDERVVQVVAGDRTVSITQPGPLGDQPIAEFAVEVPRDGRVTVALDPPEEAAGEPAQGGDGAEGSDGGDAADASDAGPAAASTVGQPEEAPTGSLVVESSPPGATVLLDDEPIGTTPLRTFGVEAGRYELVLQRPLFHESIAAVDVMENQQASLVQELRVNGEAPEIEERLLRPAAPSIASLAVTAAKAGYLIARAAVAPYAFETSVLYGDPLLAGLDFVMLSSMFGGSLLAHESPGRRALGWTGMGLIALGPITAITIEEFMDVPPGASETVDLILDSVLFVDLFGSIALGIIDLAFTPAAAQRRNEELIGAVQETGAISDSTRLARRRMLVEVGAGTAGRFGYVHEVFPPYGRVEAGLGTGLIASSPVRFTPVASVRAAARPLAGFAPGIHPELSVLLQGETDFKGWGLSVGGAFGAVFSFERFELFWRSNYIYGLRTGRDGFASSFGVSL